MLLALVIEYLPCFLISDPYFFHKQILYTPVSLFLLLVLVIKLSALFG